MEEDLYFTLESSEYTECECDICDDSGQSGSDATVESRGAVGLQDLLRAIGKAVVLVSLNSLEPGLDDVDRVVCKDGNRSGQTTSDKITKDLIRDIVLEEGGGIGVDEESHSLVA